jgi:DNA repair ATPase RecN|uniref:Major head protein n=1 Tax=virus sp. ctEfN2 TaxID=2825810 RepID=A0A8S5RN35_9VIRU|nr:MAG TPA: Major head protein [virus sp. ctEfN2]
MTREDVKKIFPDATDEQITSFLNQSNSDVAKEKAKAQKVKEQAEKADALETELEELKRQNMTDAEKAELERQKEKATNEKRISDLESALKAAQKDALTGKITSIFASAGMKGDAYAGAIKAFSNMDAEDALKEAQTFVDGISEVNKSTLDTAKAAWEKEALENTPNPGGGKSGGEPEKKSEASEYAKAYSAKMCPENKPADDNAPVNI